MKTLKLNSKGSEVTQLQLLLNIKPDGIFGPATQLAVLNFQKLQNLKIDGIVGPVTWTTLYDGWEVSDNSIYKPNEIYTPYFLPNHGYHNTPTEKKSIFLHHTAGWHNPFKVIDQWGERPHKVATEYVIGGQSIHNDNSTHDGKILQAIPNNCWAWHLGIGHQPIHRESIGIELCSFGALNNGFYEKSENDDSKFIHKNKDKFFTYVGQEVSPQQIEELKQPFKDHFYYHKYSEKQTEALRTLLLYLGNKHSINIREGLPNLIRKEGVRALEMVSLKMCVDSPGLWSHANVNKLKLDIAPQDGLIEMLLDL